MKILIGDNFNVDFDEPVEMTPDQRMKFLDFMKTMFSVVEETTGEFRDERLGDKHFFRKWTYEEYVVLVDISKTTSEVADELGRSWMSVDIKRGTIISDLLQWADQNNKDLVKDNIRELVRLFLEHKKYLRTRKKEEIKELKFLEEEESQYINSIKRLNEFTEMGMFTSDEYNKKLNELEDKKHQRIERIKELKEKLGL